MVCIGSSLAFLRRWAASSPTRCCSSAVSLSLSLSLSRALRLCFCFCVSFWGLKSARSSCIRGLRDEWHANNQRLLSDAWHAPVVAAEADAAEGVGREVDAIYTAARGAQQPSDRPAARCTQPAVRHEDTHQFCMRTCVCARARVCVCERKCVCVRSAPVRQVQSSHTVARHADKVYEVADGLVTCISVV